MSFLGSHIHTLDAKNRVFIPSKFREELGNTFYVTRKFDPCLSIYTEDEWAIFLEKIERLPDSVAADVQEFLLGAAQKCVLDGSGRIIFDEKLLNHASIKKSIVFVGAGKQIKVWAEEIWNEHEKNRDLEKMRSILAENGL